jgi:glycosyltransferase involved in cell wall biosynthesis
MKKSILVINWRDILNPEAGGAEIYYHEIFKRLVHRGFDVTVLAHSFDKEKEVIYEGIKTIRIGNKYLFNYSVIPWLIKNSNKYNMIIEDLNKVPFFTPLFVRRPRLHMVMHFFGKSIFQETNFILASYIYLMEKLFSPVYKKESFVAISRSTREDIVKAGVPEEHVHIVEPGIDTSFFHPTVPKASSPVLAYVGRLMKYKNVQFLIRSLPVLKREIPEVKLEIAGSGDYLEELKKIAEISGVADLVSFLGRIDESTKRDFLSRATIFVNPSAKEGWGINNIEANLCGTVSLSSNVEGLRDSVQDEVTGLLYEPGNIDDFCSKAVTLLKSNELRERLQENALDYAKSLDWDIIAGKMEDVIRKNI